MTDKIRRAKLGELRPGAIVRFQGDWGVLMGQRLGSTGRRIVDFWSCGKRSLAPTATVDVLEKR